MKISFVTYFDSYYLSRGLVLYESLCRNCIDFVIYIIAFDDDCYEKLCEFDLSKAVIIPYYIFEDSELLSVKESRPRKEYLWTTTPKTVQYVFDNYDEKLCIYVDADVMFFGDPEVLIDEMHEQDAVMITEHRFADYCDHTESAGKYNVQFMPFKSEKSKHILNDWKKKCLDKCCLDPENGYCGDQKYLDDWQDIFDDVHVMENLGGGVAPWNVSKYSFNRRDNIIYLIDNANQSTNRLIFYHFHSFVFFDKGVVRLADQDYRIPDTAISYIYKEYIKQHENVVNKYNLDVSKWCNIQCFLSNNIDELVHSRNYYLKDLFL